VLKADATPLEVVDAMQCVIETIGSRSIEVASPSVVNCPLNKQNSEHHGFDLKRLPSNAEMSACRRDGGDVASGAP
jgi:hypothetical protein